MQEKRVKYPIGEQDLRAVRLGGMLKLINRWSIKFSFIKFAKINE